MAETTRRSNTNLVEVGSCLFLLAVVLAVILPAYGQLRHRRQQQAYLQQCRHNLLALQQRLDAWAARHGGLYPERLEDLVGESDASLPRCPAAGEITYAGKGYEVKNSGIPRYTLSCHGNHHVEAGMGLNEPFYNSIYGLGPLSDPSEEWVQLQKCRANLERLRTAVEEYRRRHKGEVPDSLEVLVEARLLGSVPACPAVGWATYRRGYQAADREYTIACFGVNHSDVGKGAGEPYYSSRFGMSP